MKNFDLHTFAKAVCHDKRTLEMFRFLVNNSYVRVINYHNTNRDDTARLDAEIKYFSEHFSSVTVADMDEFFRTRKWPKEKPGLIPAVFEGFRSHYDVMLPILDKYSFTGWFYVPSFFMDIPVEEQIEYGVKNDLEATDKYPDGRQAMNWDELREIAKRHEICCHTANHFRLTKHSSDEDMRREIVDSKHKIERETGRRVDVFCWLYGEEYNYNIRAHKYLEEAGYKYVVSNLKMEKIK
jgi:peptidoglycan/xylan/chitin deacetylase (PgdA/CDA1 family)